MARHPDWRATALAAARQPPHAPRVILRLDGCVVGSVEAGLAARLAEALPTVVVPVGAAAGASENALEGGTGSAPGLAIAGPPDQALAALAHWLRANDLTEGWRDELLAVLDDANRVLGRIERGAVRPLGMRTRAVHLVGYTGDGRLWLQQRARDKAVDPGQWDTLMGGLLAADETIETALERELWEEAGLHLQQLEALARGATLRVERPLERGYMVEDVEPWFACVPDGIEPRNLDGEVERFDRIAPDAIPALIDAPGITLEARLALIAYLDWRASDGVGR